MTGVNFLGAELAAKRLGLLRQLPQGWRHIHIVSDIERSKRPDPSMCTAVIVVNRVAPSFRVGDLMKLHSALGIFPGTSDPPSEIAARISRSRSRH